MSLTRQRWSGSGTACLPGHREVRHTVIRVIAAHLKDGAAVSWQGLNFDFTGVVFDGGSFAKARFSGGEVSFDNAKFAGGTVGFESPSSLAAQSASPGQFSGGTVSFYGAESQAATSASTAQRSPAAQSTSMAR